jgi:prepilin-type N-terminal cleavage/methylation domain-containing protein
MFRRSEKGFTLVELMIVVVIIGILAAIAIPKFSNMIGKTKTAEAKQILGQIISLENTYWNTNSSYVDFARGANCPEIGFSVPEGQNVRFEYDFADSLATAYERIDTNGDGAADDGLILSVTQRQDQVAGTAGDDLTW